MKQVMLALLLSATGAAYAQTPLQIRHFTPAQKTEWANFSQHWHGNGKGTCIPIMAEPIRDGRCTRFDFTADLTIGKNGKIQAVKVLQNNIVCEDKKVQSELLQCFTHSLREDQGLWREEGFSRLRGRILRQVAL
jgi:hypothetical protein